MTNNSVPARRSGRPLLWLLLAAIVVVVIIPVTVLCTFVVTSLSIDHETKPDKSTVDNITSAVFDSSERVEGADVRWGAQYNCTPMCNKLLVDVTVADGYTADDVDALITDVAEVYNGWDFELCLYRESTNARFQLENADALFADSILQDTHSYDSCSTVTTADIQAVL